MADARKPALVLLKEAEREMSISSRYMLAAIKLGQGSNVCIICVRVSQDPGPRVGCVGCRLTVCAECRGGTPSVVCEECYETLQNTREADGHERSAAELWR